MFPGDTLHMRYTVIAARVMQSRPHVGLVQLDWQMFNQHDEAVLSMQGWGMFGRRPADAGTAA